MYLTEHTEFTERKQKEQSVVPRRFALGTTFPSVASVSSSELCERVRDLRRLSGLPRAARGFTLIELLIVMVVISILVGITIPIAKYVTRQARLASQRIYIEKIKSALEDYRAAYGEYPITPKTNDLGTVLNYDDALRHYPALYFTKCYYITNPVYSDSGTTENSPYTRVSLATNTVEDMGARKVDYCLTYPLMLKQRDAGARPFMEFKDETVMHLVYNPKELDAGANPDVGEIIHWFRIEGSLQKKTVKFIRGNPINRPKAVDPVSQKQWKYVSENGVTYSLTTNAF